MGTPKGFALVAGKLYTQQEAIEMAIKILKENHPWGSSTKDDLDLLRKIAVKKQTFCN